MMKATVRLGDIAREDRRTILPKSKEALSRPFLGLEQIEPATGRILSYENSSAEITSNSFAFDTSHVLYGKLRPYLNKVAVPDRAGRCSTEIIPLLPNGISREFLAFLLRTDRVVAAAMKEKTGSRMPRANINVVLNTEFSIPVSDKEQTGIANRLESAFSAISSARKALELRMVDVKSLYNLVLSRELSSEHILSRVNKVLTLGEHCSKIGSGSTPRGGDKTYIDNGIPLIRSQNVLMRSFTRQGLAHIASDTHADMAGTVVQPGDVLLNITGASIGRVCLVPDDVCPANVNQHVSIIRCTDRIDPRFLMLLLSSPEFQKNIDKTQAGGTRQALTKADIMRFHIPAIEIDEQRALAAKLIRQLRAIDEIHAASRLQLQSVNLMPQRLLAEIFE